MRQVVQVEDVQGHRSVTRSVTPGDFYVGSGRGRRNVALYLCRSASFPPRRLSVPGGKVANRDNEGTDNTEGRPTLSTAPPHVFYLKALFDMI